jgi:hypothetical protein
MDRLVIVYSTCYRNWEGALPSQMQLFEHLGGGAGGGCGGGTIVGAHYWTEKWGHDHQMRETAPPTPPADLMAAFPVRSTHTPQPVGRDRVTYFMDSLRIALYNAKDLYQDLYGEEMPADQPILRLRPDVFVDRVREFPPAPPALEGGAPYYMSIWNTAHRPHFQPDHPEAGDLLALTTAGALERLLSIDLSTAEAVVYAPYRAQGRHIGFMEQYLHSLLDYAGVHVIADRRIHLGIARKNNIEMLSP